MDNYNSYHSVYSALRSFGSKGVPKNFGSKKNSYNQYQTEAGYKAEQEYLNKMEEGLEGILEKKNQRCEATSASEFTVTAPMKKFLLARAAKTKVRQAKIRMEKESPAHQKTDDYVVGRTQLGGNSFSICCSGKASLSLLVSLL